MTVLTPGERIAKFFSDYTKPLVVVVMVVAWYFGVPFAYVEMGPIGILAGFILTPLVVIWGFVVVYLLLKAAFSLIISPILSVLQLDPALYNPFLQRKE
ncbi:MAG: hypothetical protein ACEQSA_00995 [Weeksellaceae bacterium]